jgi:hypothetical protein
MLHLCGNDQRNGSESWLKGKRISIASPPAKDRPARTNAFDVRRPIYNNNSVILMLARALLYPSLTPRLPALLVLS